MHFLVAIRKEEKEGAGEGGGGLEVTPPPHFSPSPPLFSAILTIHHHLQMDPRGERGKGEEVGGR